MIRLTHRLTPGDIVYYGGDQANPDGFFEVKEVIDDKWGLNYRVDEVDAGCGSDDLRLGKTWPHALFSDEYLGHGGTRFVTLESYNTYQAKKKAEYTDWATNYLNSKGVKRTDGWKDE